MYVPPSSALKKSTFHPQYGPRMTIAMKLHCSFRPTPDARLLPCKQIRTALFWDITQRVVVIPYRRFRESLSVFWDITQRVVVIPYRRFRESLSVFWDITQRVVVIPYRRFRENLSVFWDITQRVVVIPYRRFRENLSVSLQVVPNRR